MLIGLLAVLDGPGPIPRLETRLGNEDVQLRVWLPRVVFLSTQPESITRQTDHDLHHLDPNLPLHVVQDLHSTDPTQEICAKSCRLHGSHPAT